jgi:predicted PurR-regulated permease PerM
MGMTLNDLKTIKNLLVGIFILMSFSAVYFARDLFLPIMIGLLVALTLSPIVRWLARFGIPEVVSAVVLILGAAGVLGLAAYVLSGPISEMLSDLPRLGHEVRFKLDSLLDTLKAAQDATKGVEQMTSVTDGTQKVAIEQPGLLSLAAGTLASFLSLSAAGLVLAMFVLASGSLFYEKLVAALPTFSDKRRAVKAARDVERQISRYFLTITLINGCLGLCIGSALYLIGFSNAVLWGVLAFCLNFLPFVGSLIGAAGVAAFGLIASDNLFSGLLPAAVYLSLTILEGQFLTPMILGKRLELNTVSVFLTVLIWSWLWSIPGALMAVPFLVMVKVICDNVESFRVFGSFLGAAAPTNIDPDG